MQAGQLLLSEDGVRNATLDQIKTMLTFCVRGERFSDGHWGAMIEPGTCGGCSSGWRSCGRRSSERGHALTRA